jgi:hypothetical protein
MWPTTSKTLWMCAVCSIEHELPSISDMFPGTVMDGAGRIEPDPRMAVFRVIVREEQTPEDSSIINAGEIIRERRTILQSLEHRLRIGIIVRYVRPGPGPDLDRSIHRSDRRAATFLLVIDVPLSEWIVAGMQP